MPSIAEHNEIKRLRAHTNSPEFQSKSPQQDEIKYLHAALERLETECDIF